MCKFSSNYLQDFSYEGWFKNCFHVKYYFHTQDAKKDESVRKSYKYLAALHEVRNRAFWISYTSFYLLSSSENEFMLCSALELQSADPNH